MSFRRQPQASQELRRYHKFYLDSRALISQIGLPEFVVENHDHFKYFLMHGATWPNTGMPFRLEDLTPEQR